MGVRVRLSRNTSTYVPWWIAGPVYLAWAAVVVVILVVCGAARGGRSSC